MLRLPGDVGHEAARCRQLGEHAGHLPVSAPAALYSNAQIKGAAVYLSQWYPLLHQVRYRRESGAECPGMAP